MRTIHYPSDDWLCGECEKPWPCPDFVASRGYCQKLKGHWDWPTCIWTATLLIALWIYIGLLTVRFEPLR